MTSLEYIYKLFKISSDNLGVDYVKTTPTKLQSWATKNNPPFIALLDLSESIDVNDVQNNIINYDCSFVLCVSSPKDPTNEEKIKAEIESDKLIKSFLYFIKQNEKVEISNIQANETFRGSTFNGVGRGLSFNIVMPDLNDYCDIFCIKNTTKINCDD